MAAIDIDLIRLKKEKLLRSYREDPELYAKHVLQQEWWDKQREIARSIVRNKRTMVKASHSVGKTHIAGGLVNWHYDCFNPGLTLSTAPTAAQVDDVLWKEVRMQRKGRPGLLPKSSRMESSPDHFAVGYTAGDASSFQGRHEEYMLHIYEEATGVDGLFWDATEVIMPSEMSRWLAS